MSLTAAQRFRLVSFFIATAVIMAIFTILSIGKRLMQSHHSYFAYFEGESLSGLDTGALLKFHGITIGFVQNISYNPNDLTRIMVEFSVDREFPMKEDMVAQTVVVGITGLKHVDIMGGTNESDILPPGSFIQTRKSLMADVLSNADEIMGSIHNIMDNLSALTDPTSDIARIISNVGDITDEVRGFTGTALEQIEGMTKSVNRTLGEVEMIASNINFITSDIAKNTDIPQLVANLDSTIVAYKGISSNVGMTLNQSREDIGFILTDLQETMENIHELSQMLLQNPSIILRGNVQPRRNIR